jgi:biopolymer transport protein ExbB
MNELYFMIKELFEAGGVVILPLFLCALLLWYGLGYRYWIMRRSKSMTIRDLLRHYQEKKTVPTRNIVEQAVIQGIALKQKGVKNLRRHLDAAFYVYEREIGKFSTLVKIIVIIAPLLGLLGTVIGMIETFDSLGSMSLFSQSGGIAGGISQALITTQIGLSVAIPGLFIHSFLHIKHKRIMRDLEQIKEVLCTTT